MKKVLQFFISMLLTLLCVQVIYCQNSDIYYGLSIDFGLNPPKHSQIIRYINPSSQILPKVIEYFGAENLIDSLNGHYHWQDVRVRGLGFRKLDIQISYTSYNLKNQVSGIKTEERFDVFILANKHQYLYELKFWNINRLRRIFKNFN